jgi:hypothetical protein
VLTSPVSQPSGSCVPLSPSFPWRPASGCGTSCSSGAQERPCSRWVGRGSFASAHQVPCVRHIVLLVLRSRLLQSYVLDMVCSMPLNILVPLYTS